MRLSLTYSISKLTQRIYNRLLELVQIIRPFLHLSFSAGRALPSAVYFCGAVAGTYELILK